MDEYRGFFIDTETCQPNAKVLNSKYEVVYFTSAKGRATAFIDGLLYNVSSYSDELQKEFELCEGK